MILYLRLVALFAILAAYGKTPILAQEDRSRMAREDGDLALRGPARRQDRPLPVPAQSRVFRL